MHHPRFSKQVKMRRKNSFKYPANIRVCWHVSSISVTIETADCWVPALGLFTVVSCMWILGIGKSRLCSKIFLFQWNVEVFGKKVLNEECEKCWSVCLSLSLRKLYLSVSISICQLVAQFLFLSVLISFFLSLFTA